MPPCDHRCRYESRKAVFLGCPTGFEPLKIHNIAPIPLPIPDPSVAEPERLAALSGFKIFLIYLCITQRRPCRDCGFPLRWAYCCATFQSAHTREYIYLRVFGRCSFGAAITGSNFQLTNSPHSCIELHNAISKLEPAQDDQKGEITNKG